MGYKRAPSSIAKYIQDRCTLESNGCWKWNLRPDSQGYGQVWHKDYYGRLAHRVSYEINNKELTPDMTVDHTCWNKLCVNPLHLEEVTLIENNKRWADRNLCHKGHSLTVDNIYTWSGVRRCKICYNNSNGKRI